MLQAAHDEESAPHSQESPVGAHNIKRTLNQLSIVANFKEAGERKIAVIQNKSCILLLTNERPGGCSNHGDNSRFIFLLLTPP